MFNSDKCSIMIISINVVLCLIVISVIIMIIVISL